MYIQPYDFFAKKSSMKNFILSLLVTLSPSLYAQSEENSINIYRNGDEVSLDDQNLNDFLTNRGYSLNSDSVIKNFPVLDITLDQNYLVKHIIKSNRAVKFADAQSIAKNILKSSHCLGLDPWLLTGLIYKESAFNKDAVSPTNAAGLTQFTSVGIAEVNDQLGIRGTDGARPAATAYFKEQITKCINPAWVNVWELVTLKPNENGFSNQVKEVMKKNIEISITYGAVLLKTYISHLDSRNTRNGWGLETYEIYFSALQMYNGEPGVRKVNYAKGILRHVIKAYPAQVAFPKIDL